MTKVAVNWEEAEGVWRIIVRKLKDNQLIIGRKRKVSTSEKYKWGLRNLGRKEFDDVKVDVACLDSSSIDNDMERAALLADEDCRPRQLKVKSTLGKLTGLSRWTIVPFYNASYKSPKVLPWTKSTIIPMDPKMHQAMSENDSQFELLKRDTTGFSIVMGIVCVALGAFAMYTAYPMVNSYINPPQNATIAQNATRVVKGGLMLWMMPSLRLLLRRMKS